MFVLNRVVWPKGIAQTSTREAAVPDERAQESVNQVFCESRDAAAEILRRRKNNREHMRRRRADPVHSAREQEKRKSRQSATNAKLRSIPASVAQPMGRVCAMCHLRAAVEEITRLEPSNLRAEDTYKYGCRTAGVVDGCR